MKWTFASFAASFVECVLITLSLDSIFVLTCQVLSSDRISGNRLFLYTAKTGTPVYCVLPSFVVQALGATPQVTEQYFFWNGQGKLGTAVKMWEQRLHRLFELAGIVDEHAHRFRDTFAVELLLSGVPLDRISILLGHQSIRITERHYAPWTRSRQEQIEADLERAWSRDPLTATKGTQEVHGEKPLVN
jgi:integrase